MLKKITLINFMSHRETVIEPADGLTVISGENNCGKSAIVAAIQCVCSNATGAYMVRHGEKECRVILETDDGHVVEWRRANRKVSYIVDGETIDRTRGKVPEKVEQVLRMGKVEAENEEFDVHFADQKKPIFLLDGTAGQRAAFFASSSDASKLIEMQSLHKSKIADAQRQIKESQHRENILVSRIQKLQPIESIEIELRDLERAAAELTQAENEIQRLAQTIKAIQQAAEQFNRFQLSSRSLKQLGDAPRFENVDKLDELCIQLGEASLLTQSTASALDILQTLTSPPTIADTMVVETLINDLGETRQRTSHAAALRQTLELPEVPDVQASSSQIESGQKLVGGISQWQSEIIKLQRLLDELPKLEDAKECQLSQDDPTLEMLAKQIVSQNQIRTELEDLEREWQQIARQTELAHEELHQALEASGTCPTCGQELNLTRTSP